MSSTSSTTPEATNFLPIAVEVVAVPRHVLVVVEPLEVSVVVPVLDVLDEPLEHVRPARPRLTGQRVEAGQPLEVAEVVGLVAELLEAPGLRLAHLGVEPLRVHRR